jgi:cyclohexanone monooxygenase
MSNAYEFDTEAMREKYRAERDKRLLSTGTDQYNFTDGKYQQFDTDPHAGPPPPREPLSETLDVLVIGGGLGGLQLGATLRRNGIDNFRMLDVAADFGGTWYWNRYPGLRCDVESYIYLPFLEETGQIPTERYVRGSEIFAYCQKLGRHFQLYERALFQTKVTGLLWNEAESCWRVETSRGDNFKARFVVTQSGIFNRIQLPGIPGIEDFEGCRFHSARWNYDFTGGSPDDALDKLHDKKVGIIGTGATAVQAVPELAKTARHLTVFQRTPTAVGIRDNGPTDMAWFTSLPPGWQKAREISFNQIGNGENVDCPVDDGWALFFRRMIAATESVPPAQRTPEAVAAAQEAADFQLNETIRARVDQYVQDTQVAARLKAYYRTQCKRPGFSDDYLSVFNQDNVVLVDVSAGIDRITAHGVVVNGMEHELDCLIFCTGFELGTTWTHQAGYEVVGRDGQLLSAKWAKGLRTYHGLFSHGFPNIFFMGLTQTGTTISVPHMLQEQIDHISYVVMRCIAEGMTVVEATEEAETAWQDVIGHVNDARRPFQQACTPGYFNADGQAEDMRSAIGSGIYFPSTGFFEMWAKWREDGDFAGLDVR